MTVTYYFPEHWTENEAYGWLRDRGISTWSGVMRRNNTHLFFVR